MTTPARRTTDRRRPSDLGLLVTGLITALFWLWILSVSLFCAP